MKNRIFKLILLLVTISFIAVSCEKGSSAKGELHKNRMAYEGIAYELSQAKLHYWWQLDDDPETYEFDLFLGSSSVNVDYSDVYPSYSEIGNGISFTIVSSSSTELVPGTYIYDYYGDGLPNTFYYGDISINYNFGDTKKSSPVSEYIIYGTLEVAKSGEEYIFKLDCVLSDYQSFKAYFEGTVDYHDFSGVIKK